MGSMQIMSLRLTMSHIRVRQHAASTPHTQFLLHLPLVMEVHLLTISQLTSITWNIAIISLEINIHSSTRWLESQYSGCGTMANNCSLVILTLPTLLLG